MSSPNANQYRCIDDWGASAGPSGGQAGGTSGQPVCADFTAPNMASAITVAHLISSVLQRPVRLVPVGSLPPYTLVLGVGANVALTAVPSGVGY